MIKPRSPASQADSLPSEPPGKPQFVLVAFFYASTIFLEFAVFEIVKHSNEIAFKEEMKKIYTYKILKTLKLFPPPSWVKEILLTSYRLPIFIGGKKPVVMV